MTSGTITAPSLLSTSAGASLGWPQIITSQIDGTPGGVGDYQTSLIKSVASSTFTSRNSPFLTSDSMRENGYVDGLYQNITLEIAFEYHTNPVNGGALLALTGGVNITSNTTSEVSLTSPGAGALISSGNLSLNVAHFATITADAGTPENLTLATDNGTPVTATTTAYSNLNLPQHNGWTMGTSPSNNAATACIASAAVYNDIESPAALRAHYNVAHTKWATP